MPATQLTERVAELLAAFRPRVSGQAASELDGLLTRLRQPVRVAVMGRVKAGKSTMVNALLAQRVAPTDVSECTKVVTWFHYGHPERLELVRRDGARSALPLSPSGTLPTELGVPVEHVRALHVYLANETLKDLTLIDTPGIASVHDDYSASTQQLLARDDGEQGSTEEADAVVFLLNQVVMHEEFQALELFSARKDDDSAANTLGVLSKADKLGDGEEDPWPVAVALAARYTGQFRDQVATVVPVVGLLAETAETAALTEADARAIAGLARMEPAQMERLLWSPDRFVSGDAPVAAEARQRLLTILDFYGIRRSVEAARAGTAGALALRRELAELSGISQVKAALMSFFRDRDHLLKARSALSVAERLSYRQDGTIDPAVGMQLRSAVEALKLEPLMHPLNELEAWQDCRAGKVSLPADLQEDFDRITGPGSVAARLGAPGAGADAVREVARDAMVRWRRFMVTDADPGQARIARIVLRSYQLAWSGTPTGAGDQRGGAA